ncbi:FtsB family cell division protein [Nonomuraea africana]|uniref:Cell division protein FtsB n=1 Tax=Nonomuraea africana TaxID=46171 RepID=A0ABR9KPF5_9ACTN|nr:septum formation initiator family protein [Nonomuraea africana]MBE1563488.1 cell division protein FtsB [Nonomuraea africana]
MAKRPQLTGRAAILAVVVCAIAMSLAYPVREYVAQRRAISQLQAEKAKELEEQRRLAERQKQLQDPNYIKREARRRLHYCGAGEKCYMVADSESKQTQAGGRQQPTITPPWYQTLWESVEAADTGKGVKASAAPTAEEKKDDGKP